MQRCKQDVSNVYAITNARHCLKGRCVNGLKLQYEGLSKRGGSGVMLTKYTVGVTSVALLVSCYVKQCQLFCVQTVMRA